MNPWDQEYDTEVGMPWDQDFEAPQAPETPKEDASSVGGMFHRFLEGMADPIYGASQFLENSVESVAPSIVDAVGDADAWLHDKTGGFLGKPAGVDVDEQLRRREQAYDDTYDVDGIDWARGAGNVATGVALAPAIAAGSSLPATAGILAAEGAAGGAFMPQLGEDDYWSQVGEDALVGGLTAGIGGTALHKGGQALTNRMGREAVQVLDDAGIETTVGMRLGGAANQGEQAAGSIGLFGANTARGRANESFQNAVINQAIESTGETVEGSGRKAIALAQQAKNRAYDRANELFPEVKIDAGIRGRVYEITDIAKENAATTGVANRFQKNIESVFNQNEGTISFEKFKQIETAFDEFKSQTDSKAMRDAYDSILDTIKNQAVGQSDEFKRALAQADAAHARLAIVEDASMKAAHNTGGFTPVNYLNSIKGADKTARRNAFAGGRAPMQDVAEAAQEVIGDTVGDSGTAGRTAVLNMLGAGAGLQYLDPTLLATAPLGLAGSTRIGQKGIVGLLDMLAKGGEKVGREGRAMGSLLSYLGDD